MASSSRASSLTPSLSSRSSAEPGRRSTSGSPVLHPEFVQPDHFYGMEWPQDSDSSDDETYANTQNGGLRKYLSPLSDPSATRGIPVFKPTLEEFTDFEGYMTRVEPWGIRSGIVKIIPPQKWRDALPKHDVSISMGKEHREPSTFKDMLANVSIRSPIEQNMMGGSGRYKQQNIEKRKAMTVREWVQLCDRPEYAAPPVSEVGVRHRDAPVARRRQPSMRRGSTMRPKEEEVEHDLNDALPKKGNRKPRETPEEKAARNREFIDAFDVDGHWLPSHTTSEDYTVEACLNLERYYWRNCSMGRSPWYGADTPGTLFTSETNVWNVGKLDSTLSRLLPSGSGRDGLPGVNTPYLYFGMWRATFAWHVEDMDLFSINYIHFGAPKFWYAVPQSRAKTLEGTMRGFFPKDTSSCPEFLRHKAFLVSPMTLEHNNCKPNKLVQHAGEFVITYPRGYHAGFNLGLNCAESVNFALESWIELGKKAKACQCIGDSVRIDVQALLAERALEKRIANGEVMEDIAEPAQADGWPSENTEPPLPKKPPRKRKVERNSGAGGSPKKKPRTSNAQSSRDSTKLSVPTSKGKGKAPASQTSVASKAGKAVRVKLTLGPDYPCCLCVSTNRYGLLQVWEPDIGYGFEPDRAKKYAHEFCARVVPETWVDDMELSDGRRERMVFGVDAIVKDRWNLKCSACTKSRPKVHGAPIQCTKGKCPKAFHVSCAYPSAFADDVETAEVAAVPPVGTTSENANWVDNGSGVLFALIQDVEKEVLLFDPVSRTPFEPSTDAYPSATDCMDSYMDLEGADVFSGLGGGPLDVHPPGPSSSTLTTQPDMSGQVIKTVKKLEVHVICAQHNPAIAAQKRAAKISKIRDELLALPPMSRIKLRVSAGVFEVSLVRVIEETSSVEVLWDRGVSREFKWGTIIFGNTEGPVQQKPSEFGPQSDSAQEENQQQQQQQVDTRCSNSAGPSSSTPAAAPQPHYQYYHPPPNVGIASLQYYCQSKDGAPNGNDCGGQVATQYPASSYFSMSPTPHYQTPHYQGYSYPQYQYAQAYSGYSGATSYYPHAQYYSQYSAPQPVYGGTPQQPYTDSSGDKGKTLQWKQPYQPQNYYQQQHVVSARTPLDTRHQVGPVDGFMSTTNEATLPSTDSPVTPAFESRAYSDSEKSSPAESTLETPTLSQGQNLSREGTGSYGDESVKPSFSLDSGPHISTAESDKGLFVNTS